MSHRPPLHGLMAEFATPQQILEATRRAHQEGYRASEVERL